MRAIFCTVLMAGGLFAGDRLEFHKTHTLPFPNGGTVRIPDSFGEVEIEAWDREEFAVDLVKKTNKRYDSAKEHKAIDHLERVDVRFDRHGDNDLTVTTVLADRSLKRPLRGESNLQLTYKIKVPRNTRLEVKHGIGVVNVRGVDADMNVTVRVGMLEIAVPGDSNSDYQVDARARIGDVESEFNGNGQRRKLLGAAFHGYDSPTGAGPVRRISARVGIGSVSVQRRTP